MKNPVVLIGGNGFVGRALTRALLAQNYPVVITSRQANQANTVAQSVSWRTCDVHDPEALNKLLADIGPVTAVINLVGILHGQRGTPYGKDFLKAHVELPQKLMAAMKQQGQTRFIHVSALGADSKGPSMYLRSKGDAEALIRNSGLNWTILKPSVIFGREDNFINMFAQLSRFLRVFPLAGDKSRLQPVSVEDVAHSIVKCLELPQTIHQTYDLAGPSSYSLAELVKLSARKAGRSVLVIPLPLWLGRLQAGMMELLPKPLMSRDNLDSLAVDSVLPNGVSNPLTATFGITPTPLETLL